MATISFCSSLIATPSHKQTTQSLLSHSRFCPGFLSSPIQSLKLQSPFCNSRLQHSSSFLPKLSLTEEPVTESEPVTSDIVPVEDAEVENSEPKAEQMFAVIVMGSRQYIVFPGRHYTVQRLKGANVNDKIILNKVLLIGTKDSLRIGYPVVENAVVHAVVEEQGLNPKVVVFKYKKKKNYRRNIGHRQPNTRIRILGFSGYENTPAITLEDSLRALETTDETETAVETETTVETETSVESETTDDASV